MVAIRSKSALLAAIACIQSVIVSPVVAQQAPRTPPMNDERRAALARFEPVIGLIAYVTQMDLLLGRGSIVLGDDQKAKLKSLLMTMQQADNIGPDEAKAHMVTLKSILTPEQEDAVRAAWAARDAKRREDGPPKGPPPSLAGRGNPPPPPPGGGLDAAIMGQGSYNPFGPEDPVAGVAVTRLLQRLDNAQP